MHKCKAKYSVVNLHLWNFKGQGWHLTSLGVIFLAVAALLGKTPSAVRDPWHGSPSIVHEATQRCMWDDDMINKPVARLALFGFCLCGIGRVFGEICRVTKCLYVCVSTHVGTTWLCKRRPSVLIYIWLPLTESELKRQRLCDVFPPSVERWRLQCILPRRLHHCLSSLLPAPSSLCSLKVLYVCEKKTDIKAKPRRMWGGEGVRLRVRWWHFTQQRVSWLWYCTSCKTRANEDAALLERGGSACSSVSKLWEGILSSRRALEYFVGPWVFLDTSGGSVCVCLLVSDCVFLCWCTLNQLSSLENKQLPYHQSCLSRLYELIITDTWILLVHSQTHTCNHTYTSVI